MPAWTVKVDVATVVGVPVIAADELLIDNPAGKEPAVIEYVIVSPSASVAAAEANPEAATFWLIVPNVPAAVANTGKTAVSIKSAMPLP